MAKRTGPTQEQKMVVRTRSRSICERCGITLYNRPSDIHHRKPRGMGGGNREAWVNLPANLVQLCRDCHSHIEANANESRAHGWKISGDQHTAAQVPIIDVHGNAFVLDNFGTKIPVSAEMYKDVLG